MSVLKYQSDCNNIPWVQVPLLLEKVGMSFTDVEKHKISFENSYAVVFVFDGLVLIGMGRILSDGVRQSSVYDIAVDPLYQGKRIGQSIMQHLMAATPDCNFILYASPGKESFYRKIGFKKMKTGMAYFACPDRMTDGVFVEDE